MNRTGERQGRLCRKRSWTGYQGILCGHLWVRGSRCDQHPQDWMQQSLVMGNPSPWVLCGPEHQGG